MQEVRFHSGLKARCGWCILCRQRGRGCDGLFCATAGMQEAWCRSNLNVHRGWCILRRQRSRGCVCLFCAPVGMQEAWCRSNLMCAAGGACCAGSGEGAVPACFAHLQETLEMRCCLGVEPACVLRLQRAGKRLCPSGLRCILPPGTTRAERQTQPRRNRPDAWAAGDFRAAAGAADAKIKK